MEKNKARDLKAKKRKKLKKKAKMGMGACQVTSVVSPFVTFWTVAQQALLSMGFSRQEYWSGLPFPSPGDLPNPGDQTGVSCIAGRFFTIGDTKKALVYSQGQ